MSVTKQKVIQTAWAIADRDGLNNLSLKVVAEKLSIRTPSLYNHIESLEGLFREMAHEGMRVMNARMLSAAVGKAGDSAVGSVCAAYLEFMILHPGVYESVIWACWHPNDETFEIVEECRGLFAAAISAYKFREADLRDIVDLLFGFLHGYTTMRLGAALVDPQKAQKDLANALETVILGMRERYGQTPAEA